MNRMALSASSVKFEEVGLSVATRPSSFANPPPRVRDQCRRAVSTDCDKVFDGYETTDDDPATDSYAALANHYTKAKVILTVSESTRSNVRAETKRGLNAVAHKVRYHRV
jgi:hypothetical protein